jgi:hypothetical protein
MEDRNTVALDRRPTPEIGGQDARAVRAEYDIRKALKRELEDEAKNSVESAARFNRLADEVERLSPDSAQVVISLLRQSQNRR